MGLYKKGMMCLVSVILCLRCIGPASVVSVWQLLFMLQQSGFC